MISKKWPKTNSALEDNGYEIHVFVYNKKHDMLVLDMKRREGSGKRNNFKIFLRTFKNVQGQGTKCIKWHQRNF